MSYNQYIYCFSTFFEIEKKFKKNEKPEDYAVYKIGKTTRDIDDRMKEHGDRVDEILFKKNVYDCHTLEEELIELSKKI